ncbi:hypothetical protein [Chitinivorax sp. B]|uniref:hypothetical protein n=1 Tax=Chitinivorax sp. B TaxID=2502235 RepID=UPI0010F69643|nr:hypothetical protein [Chitinivorax sp. B]
MKKVLSCVSGFSLELRGNGGRDEHRRGVWKPGGYENRQILPLKTGFSTSSSNQELAYVG